MYLLRLVAVLALAAFMSTAAAQTTISRGKNLSVDVAPDGRVAIDLHGDIWIVPGAGGDAVQLTHNLRSAQHPRWSPDGSQLVYQGTAAGKQGLWILDPNVGTSTHISDGGRLDVQPDWHPEGERIIYASAGNGTGFDLWEVDIPTQLRWRITHAAGDETDPAWSANGRDLVYVHRDGKQWALILRRQGRSEEVLVRSREKISSPSWRPDGSLITYLQRTDTGTAINMAILSRPRLIRRYADRENFDGTAISWLDRQRMVYAANGFVRQRTFDSWTSRPLHFRAVLEPVVTTVRQRERPMLSWGEEPGGEIIIHTDRLFDGVAGGYQFNKDVLISGGRITAVEDHRERSGTIVIDMGDLVVLPGLIDADARVPGQLAASHGPDLLTMGITTIVAQREDATRLNDLWTGKTVPGPRFLSGSEWQIDPPPPADLDPTAAVTTSRLSGRSTGAALPMQLRTLEIAGLNPEQILRALGVNAAGALLADPYLGRIAPGAAADLLLVDGDPLKDINDLLNVVAVVRNGRFFSVSGLVDRAKSAESVE